jgi:hypothetical protein
LPLAAKHALPLVGFYFLNFALIPARFPTASFGALFILFKEIAMSNKQQVPVPVADDELSFKSCATEVFRWVRGGIALVEEMPEMSQGLADDVAKAWDDSAKP